MRRFSNLDDHMIINIAESRQDCVAHAADIEKALFFGQKSRGTRNGQAFRTLDGLLNIVGNLALSSFHVFIQM